MLWLSLALAPAAHAVDADAVMAAVSRADAVRAHRAMPAPTIEADDYRRTADGRIVTGLNRVQGSGARRAWGIAIIDAPIEVVWAGVNDFASHPELTQVEYAEIQSGSACKSGRKVFQYLPVGVPMISDRWWVTLQTATDAVHQKSGGTVRELTSVADVRPEALTTLRAKELAADGTPVAFSKGGWFLTQVDDTHTLAEFTAWTDPGGYVPASIATSFAAGGVEDNLEALRKLVAQGPNCPIE